jgi:hypothetical protein
MEISNDVLQRYEHLRPLLEQAARSGIRVTLQRKGKSTSEAERETSKLESKTRKPDGRDARA